MSAKIELYDVQKEPDDMIAWSLMGHVPRKGDVIILNALDGPTNYEIARVEWFMDDGESDEIPQVCLYGRLLED